MQEQNLSLRERQINIPILNILGIALLLVAALLLVFHLSRFTTLRQNVPESLVINGVNLDGMSYGQAQTAIEQIYEEALVVRYRDEEFLLYPEQVGFHLDSEATLNQAQSLQSETSFWESYWNYLWRQAEDKVQVDIIASYSQEQLQQWLADIAVRYDSPPQPAQPVLSTLSFDAGQSGYTLNLEQSRVLIEQALFDPSRRSVDLIIEEHEPEQPNMQTLQSLIVDFVVSEQFDGVVSFEIIDLKTGNVIAEDVDFRGGQQRYLDCIVPYAATSTMKIPITIDYFRHLAWLPTEGSDQYKILTETLWESGNISANFIMQDIGFGNVYNGVDDVRAFTQTIGMENTFIVAPYDEEEDPEYFSTPAREQVRAGACVDTYADSYMQTTASDLALALDMVYQCAEFGGGSLVAIFPEAITQGDCQMIIDLLANNLEGEWLIMSGVPPEMRVAHKHGYTTDTHGDAAIVFTPGGDYVLSVMVWADVSWLDYSISSTIVEGISRAVFNYFNPDLILSPRRGTGIDN